MADKTVPWWRKALNYALEGIRSGFGLFSRPPKLESAKEHEIVVRPEKSLEEETVLTYRPANPETFPAEPLKPARPAIALTPPPAPQPVTDPLPAPTIDEVVVIETPAATVAQPVELVTLPEPVPSLVPLATPEAVQVAEPVAATSPDKSQVKSEAAFMAPEVPIAVKGTGFSPFINKAKPTGALSATEKPLKGTGFSPYINPGKSARALGPEEEFSGKFPVISPLSEASAGTPKIPRIETTHEPGATPVIETEAAAADAASELEPFPLHVSEKEPETEPAPAPEIEPEIHPIVPITEPPAEPEVLPEPVPDPAPVISPPIDETVKLPAAPPNKTAPPPETVLPLVLTSKPLIKLETRDNEADLSPFSVVVDQVYDGPLDLLLDLIRKQDIDIYDIPIAKITAQFLAYVHQLKASDVDVAGEFIYIASLLIHIKSKMLLPRSPSGPDEAAEDPRRELVERLLEHERFKNAAQMLQQKQMLEAATWTNPGFREFKDDDAAEPEIAADTVDLVRVFRDIIERARNRPVIDVEEDSVTVGQMIQFLARRLTMEDKPVALRRLLSHTRSERALIAMFLALLELVRLQAVLLRQDRQFSEIFIKKHANFDAVMNEGLANARDDWR